MPPAIYSPVEFNVGQPKPDGNFAANRTEQ